jgi:pilus assembly protein Flp/PilA
MQVPKMYSGLQATAVVRDRRAVTSLEYAIIALVVILAIFGGLSVIGGKLSNDFNNVGSAL